MNRKTIKKIDDQVSIILVAWLKTLVTPEEAKLININNYKNFLHSETHVHANGKLFLSYFSTKWVRKQLKKIVSKQKDRDIQSITLEEVLATWKK